MKSTIPLQINLSTQKFVNRKKFEYLAKMAANHKLLEDKFFSITDGKSLKTDLFKHHMPFG